MMEDVVQPGTSFQRTELLEDLFLAFRQGTSKKVRDEFLRVIMNETSNIPIKEFEEAVKFLKRQESFPQNVSRAIRRQFFESGSAVVEAKEFSCGKCTNGIIEYRFPRFPIYRWLVACSCPGGKGVLDKWKGSFTRPEQSVASWIREKETEGHVAEKTLMYQEGFKPF